MAKLIMNPSSGSRKEIPVVGRVLSIGRDPSNDLVLSDSMVSRRHAILELRGDSYVLRDNNSSNGTLVNGDRVSNEQPVRDGDLIAIGSCKLLFQSDAGAGAHTPVPVPVPAPAAAPIDGAGAAGTVVCTACGATSQITDRFCRQCGKPLPPPSRQVICSACGSSVVHPANFCAVCGKPVLKEEQRRVPTQPIVRQQPVTEGLVVPPPPPVAVAASTPEPARPPLSVPPPIPSAPANRAHEPAPSLPREPPPVPEAARHVGPRAPLKPGARLVPAAGAVPRAEGDEAAGFWIRLAAYLVDSVILAIPMTFLVFGVVFAMMPNAGSMDPASFIAVQAVMSLGSMALSAAYLLYFWTAHGWTPGKRLFGLVIVTSQGESPISFGCALLRLLGYFLNVFILGIGFLLIAFSEEKLGLHDRIADTRVVRRR